MIKSNFHTHSVYCDGADTPEETVIEAIRKGFIVLGFSGHSFFEKDKEYCMDEKAASEYRRTINMLKEKYKSDIRILCGVEQDYYSTTPVSIYDYVIGSVHNIYKDGKYLAVDAKPEELINNLDTYYGGSFDAFAEDYFKIAADVVNKTNADIIGHFDLILKYSENIGYTPSKRFFKAAEEAIDILVKFKRPFEINTGGMVSGARSVPYPSSEILEIIKSKGGTIVFSSDCHDKTKLDSGFEIAEKIAKDCGFTHHGILTDEEIEYIPII